LEGYLQPIITAQIISILVITREGRRIRLCDLFRDKGSWKSDYCSFRIVSAYHIHNGIKHTSPQTQTHTTIGMSRIPLR